MSWRCGKTGSPAAVWWELTMVVRAESTPRCQRITSIWLSILERPFRSFDHLVQHRQRWTNHSRRSASQVQMSQRIITSFRSRSFRSFHHPVQHRQRWNKPLKKAKACNTYTDETRNTDEWKNNNDLSQFPGTYVQVLPSSGGASTTLDKPLKKKCNTGTDESKNNSDMPQFLGPYVQVLQRLWRRRKNNLCSTGGEEVGRLFFPLFHVL